MTRPRQFGRATASIARRTEQENEPARAPFLAQPSSTQSRASCFHCGEPLNGCKLAARIRDRDEPVCCAGCLAVAELIAAAGLHDFYRYRNGPSVRPEAGELENDTWSAYERPEIAAQFVTRSGNTESVSLSIEGLRCAACSWLIDRLVAQSPGVQRIDVNTATGRAHVEWHAATTNLGRILRSIAALGYRPYPAGDDAIAKIRQDERRSGLKRLLVAAFGMMQVMMFAVATYSAELAREVMDAQLLDYFRLVSLLVTTPVLLYAGKPFFVNAWNSARTRTVGMDVPVSLALSLAFCASVWNTLIGSGEVYFDSVTMFVFFLSLGRFVEMTARHRTTSVGDALARQLPTLAHRLHDDAVDDTPLAALRIGDRILVRAGEVVPADGTILNGETHIDEALLTGESTSVHRLRGDAVVAGTLNLHAPIVIGATAVGNATVLSGIVALLHRAQAQKPAVAQAADRAAAKFLRYVLLASGVVCATWLAVDPSRAFEATLAVLVVACPCAFSIAMPAALAAATEQLAKHGALVVHPDAIESLTNVTKIVFDKTGTLTRGDVRLIECVPLSSMSIRSCLRIASALENQSEHPIAKAFVEAGRRTSHATEDVRAPTSDVTQIDVVPGQGIEGTIDGTRYRIGCEQFVAELRNAQAPSPAEAHGASTVVLGDETCALARFTLGDSLRSDSPRAVGALHEMDIATEILSGDAPHAVADIAARCSVATFAARQLPRQKLARVRALQADGEQVAMVGDGINDAPVMGAANVSIAMGRGAALALAAADIVLIGERLSSLPLAIRTAHRTLRIARQNLIWSAAYNFCALPLAAFGLIAPWAAAAGMSLSSIAVILNAMRVGQDRGWRKDRIATSHGIADRRTETPATVPIDATPTLNAPTARP